MTKFPGWRTMTGAERRNAKMDAIFERARELRAEAAKVPTHKYTHRIRHCEGDKDAWCLIALRDDGTEIDSYGGYTTALNIDDLLRYSRGLLPSPEDCVQICYYRNEDAT